MAADKIQAANEYVKGDEPVAHLERKAFIAGAIWQEQQGWVRVEDGLPKTNKDENYVRVIANVWDWARQPLTMFAIYYKGNFYGAEMWWSDGEDSPNMTNDVTHWRPLPSPPGSTPVESKEGVYRKALEEIEAESLGDSIAYKLGHHEGYQLGFHEGQQAGAIWQEQQGWVSCEERLPEVHIDNGSRTFSVNCLFSDGKRVYAGRYEELRDGYSFWCETSDSGEPIVPEIPHGKDSEDGYFIKKITHWKLQSPPGSTPTASKEGKYRKALELALRTFYENGESRIVAAKMHDIISEALKP